MENSEILMLSGVTAVCADCGDERLFVPADECDSPVSDGCEFCCTTCDAAVFLLDVLDNTGQPHRRAA